MHIPASSVTSFRPEPSVPTLAGPGPVFCSSPLLPNRIPQGSLRNLPTPEDLTHRATNFTERPLPMPDKFTGKGPITVNAWLLDMQLWLHASNINPSKFVIYGLFNLASEARAYVVEQNQLINLASLSWEHFTKFMRTAYAKPLTQQKMRSALGDLRQGNLSVLQLTRELKQCISALPYALAEYEHVHHFLRALNEPLKTLCAARPDGLEWASLDALVAHTLNREATLQLSSPGTMIISSNHQGPPLKFAGALKPKSGGVSKRSHTSSRPSTELTYFGNTIAEQADLKALHACYRCHKTGHAFGPACPEFASGQKGHASLAGRQPKGPLKAALFQK
jgi:hypothetical protein